MPWGGEPQNAVPDPLLATYKTGTRVGLASGGPAVGQGQVAGGPPGQRTPGVQTSQKAESVALKRGEGAGTDPMVLKRCDEVWRGGSD